MNIFSHNSPFFAFFVFLVVISTLPFLERYLRSHTPKSPRMFKFEIIAFVGAIFVFVPVLGFVATWMSLISFFGLTTFDLDLPITLFGFAAFFGAIGVSHISFKYVVLPFARDITQIAKEIDDTLTKKQN